MQKETKSKSNLLRAGALAGALIAAAAPMAVAQDSAPAESAPQTVAQEQSEEMQRFTSGWTDELRALHAAASAATDYATHCFENGERCVGIVLHLGDIFMARRDEIAAQKNIPVETVENWMVGKFEERYAELFAPHGIEVKVFPRPNPGSPATVVTYHIDRSLYENSRGEADLLLSASEAEVGNVAIAVDGAHRYFSSRNERETSSLASPALALNGG